MADAKKWKLKQIFFLSLKKRGKTIEWERSDSQKIFLHILKALGLNMPEGP